MLVVNLGQMIAKHRSKIVVALWALLSTSLGLGCSKAANTPSATAVSATSQAVSSSSIKVGQNAPAGSLISSNGDQIELSNAWQDKTAIIVFFRGNWCPHCQKQLGELQTKIEEFNGYNANILAISTDSKDAELFREQGINVPMATDPKQEVAQLFGVADPKNGVSSPATFVVDKAGLVKYSHVGATKSDTPILEEVSMVVKELHSQN